LAVPPETLNEEKSHENNKLWTALPQPLQGELVQALSVMLITALFPPRQEEADD